MKKYFLWLGILAGIVFSSNAQTATKANQKVSIPGPVSGVFYKQYPDAKPVWEKENGNYEAAFKYHGRKMSALFESNGKMAEWETEINLNELPEPAIQYINKHFKGVQITETAKITKNNGKTNYEAEIKSGDLLFDEAGQFLKKVKD